MKRREQSLLRLFDFSSGGTVFELLLIVCASIIVIRILLGEGRGRTEATGLAPVENTLSVDGSQTLPGREYISKRQGLAGKPDALIREDGFLVPIEMKPLAKKLRDRYVAQLLVYMRLVEEFEGKRPPYGYLLLGANRRRVKVPNSEEKQRWVDSLLVEMRGVLSGQAAKATPHPKKCEKCDVRNRCSFALKVSD
jgi:CRISPR-associated protein Cas4